jgi:protein-tyrosine sulfotransferase
LIHIRVATVLRRFRARRWRRRRYISDASPIVIGGCARSGTTLMRVMLDSHPRICCGPESRLFLPHWPKPKRLSARFGIPARVVSELMSSCRSQAEFIDRFFARYAEIRDRPRWAEKTPQDVLHLAFVFEHFPRARFVHMIRDGRDVVCSLRTHPRYKNVGGQRVPTNRRRPIRQCIDRWVNEVSAGLRFRGDPRYFEVRYEELVANPRETLIGLFEFLGEPFDARMLEHHGEQGASRDPQFFPQNAEATEPVYAHAVDRWQRDLSPEELQLVEREAGPLLRQLGYLTADRG